MPCLLEYKSFYLGLLIQTLNSFETIYIIFINSLDFYIRLKFIVIKISVIAVSY